MARNEDGEEEEEEEEEEEVDDQTGCARGITTRHPPRWRRRTCCLRFTVAAFQIRDAL
jgi:hypothetical protein